MRPPHHLHQPPRVIRVRCVRLLAANSPAHKPHRRQSPMLSLCPACFPFPFCSSEKALLAASTALWCPSAQSHTSRRGCGAIAWLSLDCCAVGRGSVLAGPCPPSYRGTGQSGCRKVSTCSVNNGGCVRIPTQPSQPRVHPTLLCTGFHAHLPPAPEHPRWPDLTAFMPACRSAGHRIRSSAAQTRRRGPSAPVVQTHTTRPTPGASSSLGA